MLGGVTGTALGGAGVHTELKSRWARPRESPAAWGVGFWKRACTGSLGQRAEDGKVGGAAATGRPESPCWAAGAAVPLGAFLQLDNLLMPEVGRAGLSWLCMSVTICSLAGYKVWGPHPSPLGVLF